ncbi:unnamed protein product [Acanthosepion pharaonis]|uniref:Uncharacterized protein n=1 Tax=Acanthosepion pharaonis TaxID=158019 RepID=A0A812DST0_ACAPH|nr:unnamed protein product [Sepia pharaonis]
MPLLFSHCLPVSSHSYPYPFQYNSDYPLSHASALFSLIACIFSFLPLSLPIQLRLSIISCLCSSLTACLYLLILTPLSLPIQLRLSIISCLCSSLTDCLYLLILTLIPSSTTQIIHYLMPLLFSHCLPVFSHSYPYPFQYNSDYPLSHASALLSLLACIFSFLPLSLPIQLRLSIISCLCSSLTDCLYLLILTLIPSNTTQIIHYLMPLLFSH